MYRLSLFVGLLTSSLLAGGCRMCDTCYPIGGLLGKEDTECACEKCSAPPRVGSIMDAPKTIREGMEPFDPSQLSGETPTDGATSEPVSSESSPETR